MFVCPPRRAGCRSGSARRDKGTNFFVSRAFRLAVSLVVSLPAAFSPRERSGGGACPRICGQDRIEGRCQGSCVSRLFFLFLVNRRGVPPSRSSRSFDETPIIHSKSNPCYAKTDENPYRTTLAAGFAFRLRTVVPHGSAGRRGMGRLHRRRLSLRTFDHARRRRVDRRVVRRSGRLFRRP